MKASFLVASPQMRDPFFEKTVVLLWHHDEEGAIGVIVNKPSDHLLPDVVTLPDDVDAAAWQANRVGLGGPVEPGSGTVVTRGSVAESEGWILEECGMAVTRSQEALDRLIREKSDLLLCLGYAGWGPGQLDKEVEAGGWIFADPHAELIFEGSPSNCWERALASLGLTPTTVWMHPVEE